MRHCEAVGQAPESPLSPEGFCQAERLKDFLAYQPVDFLVTSEFLRARQSAAPIASANSLGIHIDPQLNERKLASEPIANWKELLRRSFSEPELRGTGGESASEALARAWASLDEILAAGHRLPVVVSHGNLISLLLHSIDRSFGYEGWAGLSNPDVYLLEKSPSGDLGFRRMWY